MTCLLFQSRSNLVHLGYISVLMLLSASILKLINLIAFSVEVFFEISDNSTHFMGNVLKKTRDLFSNLVKIF